MADSLPSTGPLRASLSPSTARSDGPWLPPRHAVQPGTDPAAAWPAPVAVPGAVPGDASDVGSGGGRIDPPRRSRRTAWLVGAACAAVVLGGLAALYSVARDADDVSVIEADRGPALPDAETFSFPAAAAQTADATTLRYDIRVTGGSIGAVEIEGGIDTDAQLMNARVDMEALRLGPPGSGTIEVIFDGAAQVVYLDAGALGESWPSDARWLAIDVATLAGESGLGIDELLDQFGANPLDTARIFDALGADEVVEVGDDEIDGVPVRHYRVTVDVADALGALPQFDDQVPQGTAVPDVVYDVWVTEDNLLRRMSFGVDAGDGSSDSFEVVMNLYQVDGTLDVTVPSADEVFDMTQLLGG